MGDFAGFAEFFVLVVGAEGEAEAVVEAEAVTDVEAGAGYAGFLQGAGDNGVFAVVVAEALAAQLDDFVAGGVAVEAVHVVHVLAACRPLLVAGREHAAAVAPVP